ncbi:MAG: hypothetical protein ACTH2O_11635, partial [Cellulosimicrobium funkei]
RGGPRGRLSLALPALLARGLGLLLLGLASVAGQLVGSLVLDAAIPALGHTVHVATVVGTVIALVAAGIGMIPSGKAAHADGPDAPGGPDGPDAGVAAAVAGGEAGETSAR